MKSAILTLLLPIIFIGCAKIQTDGEQITYSRFGSQKLSDVTFLKSAKGDLKVIIGKQESNDLSQALSTLSEAIKRIPAMP